MPNRILKETICTSETVDKLDAEAEVFFYRLVTACDDYGLMDARPSILRARCFPLKLDRISDLDVATWLVALEAAGLIQVYVVEDHPYLHLTNWAKHQTIRTARPKYPQPCEGEKTSACICMQMIAGASKCSRNPIQSESNPDLNPNLHVAPERREESQPIAPAFDEDTAAFKLSAHLRARIRENDPKAKVPNATPSALSRWSKDMDLLLRVDGREPDEVRRIIDWCQADSFWRGCVLCPATLRKQFTKLLMRASAPARASPPPGSFRRPDQDQEVMTDEQRRALEEKFGPSAAGVTGGGDWRAGARA